MNVWVCNVGGSIYGTIRPFYRRNVYALSFKVFYFVEVSIYLEPVSFDYLWNCSLIWFSIGKSRYFFYVATLFTTSRILLIGYVLELIVHTTSGVRLTYGRVGLNRNCT